MPTELPATFAVEIPDDAMAPRVRRGDVVRFTTELTPRPGDGVLVRDGAGHWYFRCYSERRPGDWEAVALNGGYQPLDSKTDNLTILAILVGIEQQRWG
jgi:SOS-response transcriptional repressor LexA